MAAYSVRSSWQRLISSGSASPSVFICVLINLVARSNKALAAILDQVAEVGSYFMSSRAGMLCGAFLDC
jgi:hypothetical protein